MKFLQLIKTSLACAAVTLMSVAPVHATDYPDRPLRLLVGYPAGGGTDILARVLADEVARDLGQPVIVMNRPGANGIVATQELLRSPHDGYTMLLVNTSHVGNALLFSTASFDLIKDFEYVTQLVAVPTVLVAHPDLPANNMQELIAFAKGSDKPLQYGSSGVGSGLSLIMELLRYKAAMPEITHVPYKGAGPALLDLMAGRIPLMMATVVSSLPYIEDGRLKPLGVADVQRSELLPNVPSIAESVPNFQMESAWMGIIVANETPAPIVQRLNSAIVRALKSPEVNARVREQGLVPVGGSPQDFLKLIQKEHIVWSEMVAETGLTLE